MKTIPLLIAFLLASNIAIDSLFGRLNLHPQEFETLKKVGVSLYYEDNELARRYIDSAYKYAPSDFDRQALRCFTALADRQLDSAIYYGTMALQEPHTPAKAREVKNNIANAYMRNHQHEEAREILLSIDSIDHYMYSLIGNSYQMELMFDSSRYYYYKVAQIAYDRGDKNYLGFTYANIANTYISQGDTVSGVGMLMVSLRYTKAHEATVMGQFGDLFNDTSYYHKSLNLGCSVYDRIDNYKGLYRATKDGRWIDSLWLYAKESDMLSVRLDSAETVGDYKLALSLQKQIGTGKKPRIIYINKPIAPKEKFNYEYYIYALLTNLMLWLLYQKRRYYLPFASRA